MKVKKHSITTTSAHETVRWLETIVGLENLTSTRLLAKNIELQPLRGCNSRMFSSSSRNGQNLGLTKEILNYKRYALVIKNVQ